MTNLLPFEKTNQKVLTKKTGNTNPNYGCVPEKRSINQLMEYGIINLNKPPGPTSHQVAEYVKKILEIDKSGHSGTLDPKVTGVLPVALSKATRVVQTLLPAGKEYIALMHIHEKLPEEQIKKAFGKFIGKIQQLPPIRSAIKRQVRARSIYYMEIIEIKERNVLFRVGCQAGTYIRKLIHDIGQSLGCGAHMAQLVRTQAGPFKDKNWHSLEDLKDAYETYKETKDESHLRKIIEPLENAIAPLQKVWIFDSAVANICYGAPLAPQGISKLTNNIQRGEPIAVLSLKGELVCLGRAILSSEEIQRKNKGIAAITEKVFMDRSTYPRPNNSI